jgi:hypothetical protein
MALTDSIVSTNIGKIEHTKALSTPTVRFEGTGFDGRSCDETTNVVREEAESRERAGRELVDASPNPRRTPTTARD